MAYYRKETYKKKYTPPNRKLQKHCRRHGELIDYTNSYDRSIYERFNPFLNMVELNCYKCLCEEVERRKENYNAQYNKIDEEAYQKYGRKGRKFESIGNIISGIGFYGFLFLWGFYSFIVASIVIGLLLLIGHICNRKYESLQNQYINYRSDKTKDLIKVREAKDIMNEQENIVSNWRIEQARLQNESKIKQERRQAERERKRKERINFSFEEIDKMTGIEFENFIKNLLQKKGFENTQTTKASGDDGVDIITYKNEVKIAVQCKRYSGKVSNSAIQEVNSGKDVYQCQKACVITNSYFTDSAKNIAKIHNVKLINRDGLFELMENANDNVNHNNKEFHQVEFNFDN